MIGIASVLLALLGACSALAQSATPMSAVRASSLWDSSSAPRANQNDLPRQRFASATSFCTYYGSGKFAELSRFDIVICHTPQMKSPDVRQLAKCGVVPIGYLSVGEDPKLRGGNGLGPG